MAEVVAFPLDRRRGLIRKQAERLTYERPRAAENILLHQLQLQADALLRKGVNPVDVEAQVKALEQAIRNEVNRVVYAPRPEGAA